MRTVLDVLVLTDEERRVIRSRTGRTGLATRAEVRRWATGVLAGELDSLFLYEHEGGEG